MAVTDDPLVGLGYARPSERKDFIRIEGRDAAPASAVVAEEVPVALVYNGRPYVVVMGTPTDLEDLAVGFSVTEGVVAGAGDLRGVDVVRASHGIEVQMEVSAADAERLSDRARGLVSRTGCGLCGVETINDALRVPSVVGSSLVVTPDAVWTAARELSRRQTVNNETSTVHGAAWATPDGEVHVVREDVGRHNALDKVFGALARAGRTASGGFVVVTSRASYEMVQKTAMCGVELLAAISRPTGLAIRFADAANVTLAALVRGESGNVYSHPRRISLTQPQE
jgi:FdhD protein